MPREDPSSSVTIGGGSVMGGVGAESLSLASAGMPHGGGDGSQYQNDSDEEEDEEYTREDMPSKRLGDVLEAVQSKNPGVLNFDACIKSADLHFLEYLLHRAPPSVHTVSLRFNNLGPAGVEIVRRWLETNESVVVLYLMGTGIDAKGRSALEDMWKRKLAGHRVDNNGYTFIRVNPRAGRPAAPVSGEDDD